MVSRDVAKNVSACKKFFLLELEARVVAATMNELGIKEIDDTPKNEKLPENIGSLSNQQKIDDLNTLAAKVVDKYILREDKVQAIYDEMKRGSNEVKKIPMPGGQGVVDRYVCRFDGCLKSFRYDGKRRRDHEKTHAGAVFDESSKSKADGVPDDVFNYQSAFLEVGMLLRNFYDAISEGDGLPLIRCWKFLLPYLKEDGAGSRKYALEALYLLMQINSLLSPQAAHRLMWNRF